MLNLPKKIKIYPIKYIIYSQKCNVTRKSTKFSQKRVNEIKYRKKCVQKQQYELIMLL